MGYRLGVDLGTTFTAAAVTATAGPRCSARQPGQRSPVGGVPPRGRRDPRRRGRPSAGRRPTRTGWPGSSSAGSATRRRIIVGGSPYSAEALIGAGCCAGSSTRSPERRGRPAGPRRRHPPGQLGPVQARPARPGGPARRPRRGAGTCTEPEAAAIALRRRSERVPDGDRRRRLRPRRRHLRRRRAAQGRPTGSSCSASPRASSASAASTSTRPCSATSSARSATALAAARRLRPGDLRGRRPAAATTASRPRRRCRPTPTRPSRCCCPALQTEVRLTRAEFEAMIRPALARDGRRAAPGAARRPACTPPTSTRCCSWAARRGSRWSPSCSRRARPSGGASTPTPSTPSRSVRRPRRPPPPTHAPPSPLRTRCRFPARRSGGGLRGHRREPRGDHHRRAADS